MYIINHIYVHVHVQCTHIIVQYASYEQYAWNPQTAEWQCDVNTLDITLNLNQDNNYMYYSGSMLLAHSIGRATNMAVTV